jgi:hypothetical protein
MAYRGDRPNRYQMGYIAGETFDPRKARHRPLGKLIVPAGGLVPGAEREMEEHWAKTASMRGGVTAASLVVRPPRRWPGGIVPFRISSSLPDGDRVLSAIEEFESRTSLRFHKQKASDKHFVVFRPGAKLHSELGRKGGEQQILVTDKASVGDVMHEIGHTVGLYHEHSRPDRKKFITIVDKNILPNDKDEFELESDGQQVGSYDYDSIMHYGTHAFAISPSKPTIIVVPQPGGATPAIGQRKRLSDGDVAALKVLYP